MNNKNKKNHPVQPLDLVGLLAIGGHNGDDRRNREEDKGDGVAHKVQVLYENVQDFHRKEGKREKSNNRR